MNDLFWAALMDALVKRANGLAIQPQLHTALLQRWATWTAIFKQDPMLRFRFTTRLVATEVELNQPEFDPQARCGLSIVSNAVDACLLAVAVAEVFHHGGVDVTPGISGGSGNLVVGGIAAHLTAVSRALDTRDRSVCTLSSNPYPALSAEPSIVLLGGVSEDATTFSDPGTTTALDKSGALPLIPLSASFKRALQGGLSALQKHLRDVFEPVVDDEYSAIKAAIKGATA
jgi:hypothetical protein